MLGVQEARAGEQQDRVVLREPGGEDPEDGVAGGLQTTVFGPELVAQAVKALVCGAMGAGLA
ncbi:hypothetical protein [Streptomyces sp. NBC_01336]|uniref:hypothetical protein n=1 Tax=unclassified Streptomyces TaxID=2593676 RepID=UPI002E1125C4|nr:hypothetical protein OG471_07455 [Streptomyces sp. NBC_01336]